MAVSLGEGVILNSERDTEHALWQLEIAVSIAAMTTSSVAQLEAYTSELAAAVKSLANYCRNVEAGNTGKTPQLLVPPDAPREAQRARRAVLANVAKLQTLLGEPADFLQQLAAQVRLSLCPKYLRVLLDIRPIDTELT